MLRLQPLHHEAQVHIVGAHQLEDLDDALSLSMLQHDALDGSAQSLAVHAVLRRVRCAAARLVAG